MRIIISLSIVMLIASCQPTPKKSGMNVEQLATIICDCAQPIIKYNDDLRALASADDMGKLTQEMAKGDEVLNTAERCITDKILTSAAPLLNEQLELQVLEQCELDKRMTSDLIQRIKSFESDTFQ